MPKISLSLPHQGTIKVEIQDKVNKGDIIATYNNNKSLKLDLKEHLLLKPEKIFSTLVKKIGDQVVKGDIIAIKKNLFGKKIIRSPVSGIIDYYDEKAGILAIKIKDESKKLTSPVNGKIDDIKNNKTITIDFPGETFEAKEAYGNKWGEIYVLNNKEESVNLLGKGYDEIAGKILIGYSWSLVSIEKALTLDCGLIGVFFEDKKENFGQKGYLESDSSSVMIVGRDTFFLIIKYHGKQGIMLSRERKLFIQ